MHVVYGTRLITKPIAPQVPLMTEGTVTRDDFQVKRLTPQHVKVVKL